MKSLYVKTLLSVLLIITLTQCSLLEDVVPGANKVKGIKEEWTVEEWGGGGPESASPKNHHYTFEVKGEKKQVILTFDTQVDIKPFVFNPLGQLISNYYYTVNKGTNTLEFDELNGGEYTIVICTQRRGDFGSYSINFSGIESTPKKVSFERLKTDKADWGVEGGAGRDFSFKNHVYTFEVTDDKSSIDCEIQSPDADIYFQVYNPLGQMIYNNYYDSGRRVATIEETTKGKYTLMVATAKRDTKGTYSFNIFGNISNLQKVESQSGIIENTWGKGDTHNYSISVTEDNSVLDITLQSSDINCTFALLDPIGRAIKDGNIYNGRYDFNIENVNKGVYKIVTRPLGQVNNQPSAMKYKLSVYGKFSDLKKI